VKKETVITKLEFNALLANCSNESPGFAQNYIFMDNTTIESIKREAYSKALKFKNTGLDSEAIYARLEKQGVPEDIAREVAKNVVLHKQAIKNKMTPTPLNSFSVWSKMINFIFPGIRL
jgi:hypothetical protein